MLVNAISEQRFEIGLRYQRTEDAIGDILVRAIGHNVLQRDVGVLLEELPAASIRQPRARRRPVMLRRPIPIVAGIEAEIM